MRGVCGWGSGITVLDDPLRNWLAQNFHSWVCSKLFLRTKHIGSPPAAARSDKHSSSSPPRITSNIKHTQRLIKIFKELHSDSHRERPSTSYRKKKAEKMSSLDAIDLYEESSTEEYFTFRGSEIVQPVLLVDGYNLCGFWPKLKKHFSRGNLELARKKLVDELATFSAIKGVKVVTVFDAIQSGLPNSMETFASVDIVFTSTSCADAWIEKEVSRLTLDRCPQVWVATSDTLHQQVARGSGAFIWSCNNLISEIKEAKEELRQCIKEARSYSMEGKLLEDNLDPTVLNSLQALKKDLR
ncbi:hypothetical protein O6H91_03G038400 [Diphasiastrum complanatum]|uniref:Uncharacterized protein n=2 Tax=Diphasiastrum complanatum TaxID=34168 RepID=A0ACC2E5J7_DIPCM|nr:hypothetical protein O6H91_03G038400 [Diphasiastrum complanatum]KAJ7561718.1 hypothetical protein O6H91_03G038400 [Diphasiastrum complanatum]